MPCDRLSLSRDYLHVTTLDDDVSTNCVDFDTKWRNAAAMNNRRKFIADAVRDRRMELGLSQSVVDIGGPSRTIMGTAEREGILPKTATVQAKFCRAMGWATNACSELEAGRMPKDVPDGVKDEIRQKEKDEIRQMIGSIRIQLEVLESRLLGL